MFYGFVAVSDSCDVIPFFFFGGGVVRNTNVFNDILCKISRNPCSFAGGFSFNKKNFNGVVIFSKR